MMKRAFVTIATMMLLVFGLTVSAANFKFGVIDLNKIMTDSPQAQKIRTSLENQFKPKQAEFTKARATFQHDAEKLRKDAAVLSKADRKSLQQKVIHEQRQLQKEQIAFQQEAMKAQGALQKGLVEKIKTITQEIAKKNQMDAVIRKGVAIYFDDAMDVTDQVLKKLNQSN